jgi:hypothetical protein
MKQAENKMKCPADNVNYVWNVEILKQQKNNFAAQNGSFFSKAGRWSC